MVGEVEECLENGGVAVRLENFRSITYFSFPSELKFASLFFYYMRYRGVYIHENFPLFLTTAHSDEDIAYVVRAFKESIIEMQACGFLAAPATADRTEHTPAQTSANGPSVNTFGGGNESPAPAAAGNGASRFGRAPMTESELEIWLA